jgi:hypothetical protein
MDRNTEILNEAIAVEPELASSRIEVWELPEQPTRVNGITTFQQDTRSNFAVRALPVIGDV